MIIWINGAFGAGKTTTAQLLLARRPELMVFDTEQIGYLLVHVLGDRYVARDFQDLVAWRRLVVAALAELSELSAESGTNIVVPQTVLDGAYWSEITGGLAERGVRVHAFTLDVDARVHSERIAADRVEPTAVAWRHERWPDFEAARPWLTEATTVLNTSDLSPEGVVDRILEAWGSETP